MKSRKYVPGILVDGRGLRGPKGEKGDVGFAISDISSILTSYITNLTDYADLTHIHGVVVGTNITATSASNGLSLSVGNYLTTAALSNHSHSDLITGAALSSHTHGSIYTVSKTGSLIANSSGSSGLTLSVPNYLTTAANSYHSHTDLYIPLANTASYQLTANNSLSAYLSHTHGVPQVFGNITVGSSSNAVLFSVSEGIKQIRLAGNTVGTAGTVSTGTMVLAGAGNVTLSQDGNTVTIYAAGGGVGGGLGLATAITGGSMTGNTDGLSINLPAYLTTARRSTDAIGLNTAITGGSMTGNSDGLSINLPAYITTAMASNAGSNFIGLGTAVTGGSLTADSRGISLNIPTFLTTAMRSDANTSFLGLATAQTSVTWTVDSRGISIDAGAYLTTAMASDAASNFIGLNTAITGGSMTANSDGISVDVSPAVGMGLVTAITGGSMTADTNGLSIDVGAAVGVGLGTTIATTTGNVLKITANTDGLNISHPDWLTTAMLSNAGSNFVGLGTAITGGSMTADSRGISVNVPTGGVQIAGSAASTLTGGVMQFANANGISFGLNSNTMTASWQSTNYVLTAVSSLLQPVANSTLSLGTVYTSHTHGALVNTASTTGTDFKFTSATSGVLMGVPRMMSLYIAGNTSGTPALISTGVAYLQGGNNITLNQVGQYVIIHGETASGAAVNHTHGSVPSMTGGIGVTSNSSAWSISIPDFLTTAANSTHIHGILNTTNINGTSASSGLSLSVPVGSVYFSNVATNNITFGSAVSGSSTTITAIAGGGTGGTGGAGGAALMGSGTYSQNSGTVRFVNANGISWDLSANSMYASMSHGSISFNNGSGVTFGTAGAGLNTTVTASVSHGTIAYNNTNGVSFGTAAAGLNSTLTASVNYGNVYYLDRTDGVNWSSTVASNSTSIDGFFNIGYLFFSNNATHSWGSSIIGVSTSIWLA
jgi:hypothetical protein